MKKVFYILLLLINTSIFAETLNIKVKGMVCAFCANGLEKKFKKVEGLKSVNVSLEKKLITAIFKGNAPLSDKQLTKMVADAGYNVSSIERKK